MISNKKNSQKISSYEKGVKNLLKNSEGFEWIIANYLVDTYNKFKSNVFPTTQIAKVLMNKLGKKKTQYPILHKIVREIFKEWSKDKEFCELVSEPRSSSKKTKKVYRITQYGFTVLKSKIINFNIQNISGEIPTEFEPNTRSREEYLEDYLQILLDKLDYVDVELEEEDYLED